MQVNETVTFCCTLEQVLQQHDEAFNLGLVKGITVKLHIDSKAVPKFCKARPVPYAMREKVEEEQDRLVKEGILVPVQFSNWAEPIVVVKKSNGSVRICGHFCMTVNQTMPLDRYPIPRVEDLLATLAGGKCFTKLDLRGAYQQLELDSESQDMTFLSQGVQGSVPSKYGIHFSTLV